MNKIRSDADKYPLTHAVVITLFATGLVSLPINELFVALFGEGKTVEFCAEIFIRLILSAAAIRFIFIYGYGKIIFNKASLVGVISVIPAIIVAVNNFPIIAFVTGGAKLTAGAADTVLYVIFCIFIGIFEETVFRGLVFPLFLERVKGKKFGVFLAVFFSSALFGGVHLINLFSGAAAGAVFLQVGYSFLIGGMCAISVCLSGNLFTAVAIHSIFDIGGLMMDGRLNVAVGYQWDTVTVVTTAVIGVIVTAYMIYRLFTMSYDSVKNLYKSDEN